jgi:hypothetical protein
LVNLKDLYINDNLFSIEEKEKVKNLLPNCSVTSYF